MNVSMMNLMRLGWALMLLAGCTGPAEKTAGNRNDLANMETALIHIGQIEFKVWLAANDQERQLGLMRVSAEELAPISDPADPSAPPTYRGMLFVFPYEMPLSFWMANTITPLDIAYIAPDGRIVKTYTMAPLETRTYPSIAPAQFALEVPAGLFAELGIAAGSYVEIPDSLLKAAR